MPELARRILARWVDQPAVFRDLHRLAVALHKAERRAAKAEAIAAKRAPGGRGIEWYSSSALSRLMRPRGGEHRANEN